MFTSKQAREEQQRLKEEARGTLKKTQRLQENLKAQEATLQKQQAFLGELARQQQAVMESLDKEAATLHAHNHKIASEIHSLKTAHIVLKDNVTERFQQQLTRSLQEMESKVQTDTTRIESLSKELHELIGDLKGARAAANQFTALAKTIRETDYQLKEHAKALQQADQEKLRLMRRVDELEGMIAKFKRTPQRSYR